MQFNYKYAHLQPYEVDGNIMKSDKEGRCTQCGYLTSFIEINAEAYFCSDECVDAFDNEAYLYNAGLA